MQTEDGDAFERAVAHLRDSGVVGFQIRELEEGSREIIAYFDPDIDSGGDSPETLLATRQRRLYRALGERDSGIENISVEPYTSRDWSEYWKQYFEPTRLSRRIAVVPPWQRRHQFDTEYDIVLEPGMAFGTGQHPTTKMCARILDELLDEYPGRRVLDVGCGSGILSMAADRLGAAQVLGLDNDPDAVDIARQNAAANGLAGELCFSTRPLSKLEESYPIVVANILANVLETLSAHLRAVTVGGGHLVLSGIDRNQVPKMRESFLTDGWQIRQKLESEDWITLHLFKSQ